MFHFFVLKDFASIQGQRSSPAFRANKETHKYAHREVYLQMINSLRDAPVVALQSRLALLQGDTMHCSLDLSIKPQTMSWEQISNKHLLIALTETCCWVLMRG